MFVDNALGTPNIVELKWIPFQLANYAILSYLIALGACSIVYFQYSLNWYWILFGLLEVFFFFYFSSRLSRKWSTLTPVRFPKRLFWTALIIRLIYVLFSYVFYLYMTGTEFDFGAADVLGYHEEASYAANLMRHGDWHIATNIRNFSECAISDTGYPTYLAVIYFLTGDNILIVRLIKAIFSAWTVLLMYRFASRNLGENVGRITAILCMLMPNLIYYCGLHLKEIEMVFLAVLFVERADYIIRKGKLTILPTTLLMLIPLTLFTIRTALAVVLIIAFFLALILTSGRELKRRRKNLFLILLVASFVGYVVYENTGFGGDVRDMWQTGGSLQSGNMEWRAGRVDRGGFQQRYARYAGAAVFAPLIFTIPFPTMAETPGQENQKMIHGGNFCKNITSLMTILACVMLLLNGDWRKYVLPLAVMIGYLVVLVFSNFAHSERFHLPSLPFELMFAAYGIMYWQRPKIKRIYNVWLVLMIFAAVAWNWFKLSGRGMI